MRHDTAMRSRIMGAFLLAVACAGARAEQDPMDKHGGHPLADRPATLAELLEQPDWGAPRPAQPAAGKGNGRAKPAVAPKVNPAKPAVVEQVNPAKPAVAPQVDPNPPNPPPAAEERPPRPPDARNDVNDLQAAIDERNRIVDRANLFNTIATILIEEKELAKRLAVLNAALRQQKQAADQVDLFSNPGATLVAPEAKAAARRAWENARNAAQHAHRDWQQQVNKLMPLHQQVRPALGPWMDCYWRMRRAVRFDKRDPDRQAKLRVLENAIRQRGDFYEGMVLAAILQVYDGNAGLAENHLKGACAGMQKFGMFGTPFANDGCYAWLLLVRPEEVDDFIAELRKLDPRQQTAVRCWLVGLSGMILCRDNEAATFLNKALTKLDVFKNGKALPAEAAALLGDAALFRLTASNEAQRNSDKAREILDKTPEEWNAWQLLRARAALAAEDGNWADALTLLGQCAEACPPALDKEIEAQRKAYDEQKPWIRPRPVGVGNPKS